MYFGGALAAPDVPIFKAASEVTQLGVCKGIFPPEMHCCVQSNPVHSFLKSTSVYRYVDIKFSGMDCE